MIVFLGFAYHPQNMKLLFAPDGEPKQIFGTAYGFSEFDREQIRMELQEMYTVDHHNVFLSNTMCKDLFHEFSRAFKLIERV